MILLLGPAAQAQIALGGQPLPGLPGGLPGGVELPFGAQQTLGALTGEAGRLADARASRLLQIRLLLRRHADVLEADPSGNPIVRGEVLAFSPTDAALARARGAGFSIVRERSLGTLGIHLVVLGVPRGTATSRALSLLRGLDPAGTYDFNNIYTESGVSGGAVAVSPGVGGTRRVNAAPLGLVDGGVGTGQAVLAGIVIQRHGCGGAVVPSAHGTEVASLMVGRSARFGGAAPGAALYAADVFCGRPTGGAVEAIAEALEWLAGQGVPVINVSLVGPPNALLQQVVALMVARGFLIVAAVGNDGPAAPPLYPAAYPGVVGVTAVDARRRVIFEAERGPQVMFAAPGADIPAATLPDGFEKVRGTSFAAPLVAGLLAERLGSADSASGTVPSSPPNPAAAHAAVDALARSAAHLGAPGRNVVFGYGLVGAGLPSPRPVPGK
ncbi:MAG: S8 family serine peptidase [Gammaproteobacteria bacterium]|nr:S8 family serine peptidase [Gammaproteobacteria bacterium]